MQKTSRSTSQQSRLLLPVVLIIGVFATVWTSLQITNLEYQRWLSLLQQETISIEDKLRDSWLTTSLDIRKSTSEEGLQNIRMAGLSALSVDKDNTSDDHDFKWLLAENNAEISAQTYHKSLGIVHGSINIDDFVRLNIPSKLRNQIYATYTFSYGSKSFYHGTYNPYKIPENELGKILNEKEFHSSIYLEKAKLNITWKFTRKALGGIHFTTAILSSILGVIVTFIMMLLIWYVGKSKKESELSLTSKIRALENTRNRFRIVSDNAFDLITVLKPSGAVEYANSSIFNILGYTKDSVSGMSFLDLLHHRDRVLLENMMHRVHDEGKGEELTLRLKHKEGNWVYLECVCSAVQDKNWTLTNYVIHGRDISVRKKYADELARSEQRFRDFADSSADWLWEVNDELFFTYISPGVVKTLGYNPEDVLNKPQFEMLFGASDDIARNLIQNRVERFQTYRDIEFWTKSKQGERVCLRISGVPVFDERHNFLGYRGAASNITTSKLDRENMFRLATTDHLTGLLNRARFNEELERVLNISQRQNTEGVLLFIDLDQFKAINDTYGHDAGDALIRAVSEVLERHVRTTDAVARLGGDEFGMIMHEIDLETAQIKVQAIIDELNALQVPYDGATLQCTMSIGMVAYPSSGSDSASLLMSADLAMYRAKEMGRNRMFIAGAEHTGTGEQNNKEIKQHKHSMREQLKWVERVKAAIEEGDFDMYYQPLVPSTPNPVPHFEALIRIKDEDGRLGAPGIFIEAAESHGLIKELDMKVVERCIEEQMALKQKGHPSTIAINLSGKSIADADIVDRLKTLIHKYPEMDPHDFTFEVTETAALHDPKALKEMEKLQSLIDSLRELGFKFALDDFGTGFSSFNYIKHLNVDCIKVDGSFILPLENSTQDQLFVKAITDLAKGLEMSTVAEFVENEEILNIIEDLGIDKAQGYHLSKPEPDLEKLCIEFAGKGMGDFKNV